ncbi:MAG: glycosyltransferase [Actinomycetota bacterium]|nr:glycosyltransferase [Actinomycetota bacterium]
MSRSHPASSPAPRRATGFHHDAADPESHLAHAEPRHGAQVLAAVSVVVPAHDAADTLADALRSALTQVPAPNEVVVVDDGSTDATVDVARSAAEACGASVDVARSAAETPGTPGTAFGAPGTDLHPITTRPAVRIICQAQSGPAAARNTGIETASQPWIAFLDADDVWHPGKLATQLDVAAAHPQAVAVASDWVRRGPTTGAPPSPAPVTGHHASDPPPTTAVATCDSAGERSAGHATQRRVPTSVITEADLLVLNRFQTSTVLARTADVRAVGGFDTSVDGVEDWDLWRRLAARGPIVKIDRALVSYTDRPEGYSKDLIRVHDTAVVMIQRAVAGCDRRTARRLRAWHHLRFAVAFVLDGDRPMAARCLRDVYQDGLLSAVPGAAARHLAPFLVGRLRRRLVAHHT